MKTALLVAGSFVLFLLLASCNDTSTDIAVPQNATELLQAYKNVPWMLVYLQMDGTVYDMTELAPLELILQDTSFVGKNSCNTISGRIRRTEDSLVFHYVSTTQMGCGSRKSINFCDLGRAWRVIPSPNMLTLVNGSEIMQFASAYTHPIDGNPLIGKTWRLASSNDTLFSIFRECAYLPDLELAADRTFELYREVSCSSGGKGRNRAYGYFGCTDGSGIEFRQYWSQGCGSSPLPVRLLDRTFLRNIESADTYSVSDSGATLVVSATGTYYRFVRAD